MKWRDQNYKPDWWPEEIWKWSKSKTLSKVNREFWKKLKLNYDFVTFMRKCVKLCLEHHNLNPDQHIAKYDEEVLNRRLRNAGVPVSPAVSSPETSSNNSPNISVEVETQTDNDQQDQNRSVNTQTQTVQVQTDDDLSDSSLLNHGRGRYVLRRPGEGAEAAKEDVAEDEAKAKAMFCLFC